MLRERGSRKDWIFTTPIPNKCNYGNQGNSITWCLSRQFLQRSSSTKINHYLESDILCRYPDVVWNQALPLQHHYCTRSGSAWFQASPDASRRLSALLNRLSRHLTKKDWANLLPFHNAAISALYDFKCPAHDSWRWSLELWAAGSQYNGLAALLFSNSRS